MPAPLERTTMRCKLICVVCLQNDVANLEQVRCRANYSTTLLKLGVRGRGGGGTRIYTGYVLDQRIEMKTNKELEGVEGVGLGEAGAADCPPLSSFPAIL